MRCDGREFSMTVPRLSELLGAMMLYLPVGLIPLTFEGTLNPIVVVVLSLILIGIHELTHALAYLAFTGSTPGVGVGPYYIYVRMDKPVKRSQFTLVALSTVIGLSALLLALWKMTGADEFAVLYFMNLIGSSGDFIMAVESLAYPSESLVSDRGDVNYFCVVDDWVPPRWLNYFRAFLRRTALLVPLLLVMSLPLGLSLDRVGNELTIRLNPLVAVAFYLTGIFISAYLTRKNREDE